MTHGTILKKAIMYRGKALYKTFVIHSLQWVFFCKFVLNTYSKIVIIHCCLHHSFLFFFGVIMKWILIQDNENFMLKKDSIVEIEETDLTKSMWYYTCKADNKNRKPILKEWVDFCFIKEE